MKCNHSHMVIVKSDPWELRCMHRNCEYHVTHNWSLPLANIGSVYLNSGTANVGDLTYLDGLLPSDDGYFFDNEDVSAHPVSFFVEGRPAPQGSKVAVSKYHLKEVSKYTSAWREVVALRASEAYDYSTFEVEKHIALRVDICYWMKRPKNTKRLFPSVTPDIDKLTRATFDGLVMSSKLFPDDGQVVSGGMIQRYALTNMPTGAHITITALE